MPLNYTTKLGQLDQLKDDLAFRVRRKVFELFLKECAPTPESRVADFGVSGNQDHPVHYFFETLYPYKGNITAIGRAAEDAKWYGKKFPELTFLEADLRRIPLPDNYFDAGLCNAVVEHAGTKEQQEALIREVCRVCRQVVFTTPNKGFVIELHTFLPFLHWLPDGLYRKSLKAFGFDYFSDIQNLNPLYGKDFLALFPKDRHNRLIKLGLPLLKTNLACVSHKVD